jgi:hypothetical protein
MGTLYDLLGALPNDDADELRAGFRRAAKRAAYDHLLTRTRHEKEQAAKHAAADKLHKVASGVMAVAGISILAVGGYALLVQLSTNALTPAIRTAETVGKPAAIVVTGPAEELAAGASATPRETSERRADITRSAIVLPAETAPVRVGPSLRHIPKHAPKFASANTDRSIFLYRLRKFTNAFAELAPAKGFQRANRPIRRQRDWEL